MEKIKLSFNEDIEYCVVLIDKKFELVHQKLSLVPNQNSTFDWKKYENNV
jgi:hypothetical protein